MMEDKLISYETAKLAKEKGFNIPVLYSYGLGGSETLAATDDNSLFDINFQGNYGFSAPTQTLLQDWLREKKIDVFVVPAFADFEYEPFHANKEIDVVSEDKEVIEFTCFINDGTIPPDGNWDVRIDGDIWQEVLEVGLFEGLKLIKL